MSGPRTIPDEARARQIRASNPEASAFVSANAGSGKTHVLVQRVIRLMLGGVSPDKILCITFTKAAAANMAERVFTTLGHWVTLGDTALDAAIRDAGIARIDSATRMRARELFACALETPGGLKVQTIHALCTRLLQQFPFEANVPARFTVMDDRDQIEMMERANLRVLLDAASAPDSAAGRALATAMTGAADMTFREVINQASLSRDHFLAWTDRAGSVETATAQLSDALGVSPQTTLADIEREIIEGPYLSRTAWERAAALFDGGGKSDIDQAERLREAMALTGAAQADQYLRVFHTDAMSPRRSLINKPLAQSQPKLAAALANEAARLPPLLDMRRAAAMRDRTQALLVIATSVAKHYREEKQARGLLDYDDLIDRTLSMLDRISSSWVHFKLDRGIDHVLIDEAQDTSPRQWDIVAHLITEFTAGKGARDGVKRTIFAVGDEKQSIFSFQGAVPREFDTRRSALRAKFEGAGLVFDPVSFTYSFRSGDAILASVDSVFREEAIYRSIHADTAYPVHQSLADAGPSLIDLWELEHPDAREEIEGWRAAFDAVSPTSPEVKLAQRVQTEIRALVAAGTQTGPAGRRRALRYGDVLILVRRRGAAFDAIIQALKHAGVPVAGADRLKLTEHIAIIDLMNLADALLLPQDDLALAVALKSPLFGLDDDDLFKLAWERKGSLRRQLVRHDSDPKIAAALKRLTLYEDRALHDTPFAFFAWLLGGNGGRARILKRLGPEANDALDEFLELALGHERRAPASLQGFMAWLRAADTDIKRDMEITRDEVRVMTVHGAKGLEAPVVFLVDTTSAPADTARLNLINVPQGQGANDPCVVVWAGAKANDPPAVAAARAAMLAETEDEYRRLLYVAMTRAADRLIVGGCMPGNRREVRENSWYDLIAKGLAASDLDMTQAPPGSLFSPPPQGGREQVAAGGDSGVVKRYTSGTLPDLQGDATTEPTPLPPPLPDWLRTYARPATPPRAAIRPSDADEVWRGVRAKDNVAARAEALKRGTLTHRLLQSLPDLAEAKRAAAAADFLARNAKDWSDAARSDLANGTLALIGDPRLAALFAKGSRAEVPIAGRLEGVDGPVLVSGQIDRLVVTPSGVLIVDYKTGPAFAQAPSGYVRQLALYRAVLAKLYPGRPIRAALLWTETLQFAEIPPDRMDMALQSVLSP